MNKTKYAHTNLVTFDWRKIAKFYIDVFDCTQVGPIRRLSGKTVTMGTNIAGAEIEGVHLKLPGYGSNGPTLEIFQYARGAANPDHAANRNGFTHIAFETENVVETSEKLIRAGGYLLGKIADQQIDGFGTCTFVYARDPDRNIIEIQSWKRNP